MDGHRYLVCVAESGTRSAPARAMANSERVNIDGSLGEGGGQVLRSSLSLSMAIGRPLRIENIRASRSKTGLRRQHLTAVRAAQTVTGADVHGAALGSTTLDFNPGRIRGGDYRFTVGTAGSATLVAQTVLPALILAREPSKLLLEGGTHNPRSPPFDFFEKSFLPVLRRMGVGVRAKLFRPGFFPAGGGSFSLEIDPPEGELKKIELTTRGRQRSISAQAVVANLPLHIAQRELEVVRNELDLPEAAVHVSEESRSPGPGNVLTIVAEFENVTEVFAGFGERGVPAETVAEGAAKKAKEYLTSNVAVGPFLADQLLVPMALAGGGRFTTLDPSRHTLTNISVIRRFLDIRIVPQEIGDGIWLIDMGDRVRLGRTGPPEEKGKT